MRSSDAPVFASGLRYTSGLADAGPNDMQMIAFGGVGPTDEGLAGGRLIGAVMRVFSHGEVRLRSADPLVDPIVEFRMLSDERDLVRLRDCVKRMIAIVRHPAVESISDSVIALTTPLDDLGTDAAIDAWLAATVNDYVHAVGTCRMGAAGDPAAVVDTDCRVIGYDALARVRRVGHARPAQGEHESDDRRDRRAVGRQAAVTASFSPSKEPSGRRHPASDRDGCGLLRAFGEQQERADEEARARRRRSRG